MFSLQIVGNQNVCGCGRNVDYYDLNGNPSCNKYMRCPTYEELREALKTANMELFKLKGMKLPTEGGGDE